MDTASSKYRVRTCFKCLEDTKFYCITCNNEMCPRCKLRHVEDIDSMSQGIVLYKDKINDQMKQEVCAYHPNKVCSFYCEQCQAPLCKSCFSTFKRLSGKHFAHNVVKLQKLYKRRRQQCRPTIHEIRTEALLYRHVILARIKEETKSCHSITTNIKSNMLLKAQTLKECIDNVLYNIDFQHIFFKPKRELEEYLAKLQRYEHLYEESICKPIRTIYFIKGVHMPKIQDRPCLPHRIHSFIDESFDKKAITKSLSKVQILDEGKMREGNERLLKLVIPPELHKTFTVEGFETCNHISCLTPDQVWVSEKNITLTNTLGDVLKHIDVPTSKLYHGSHTVNSEGELIYIAKENQINILSRDMKKNKKIMKTSSKWKYWCVYSSPSTGDLLVAMSRKDSRMAKITRYNETGKLTQTIQSTDTEPELYHEPYFITENKNGDIIASDRLGHSGVVVVTERGGTYRFTYTGPPSGSKICPEGICTDIMSHILVCDELTSTVQMIDKDGQFLLHLLIRPLGIFGPTSLSYDVNTRRLWVGTWFNNNRLSVYKYITGQCTNQAPASVQVKSFLNESQNKHTENSDHQHEEERVLSKPDLSTAFYMKNSVGCFGISCLSPDRVWVHDNNKISLLNTEGDTLMEVRNIRPDNLLGGYGIQTVNDEGDLIYIDKSSNVIKLSLEMKERTTFIKTTDPTWKPTCVYWSPFSHSLLIALCTKFPWIGKVFRYNKSCQLTQTIQHDIRGLEMFAHPRYITENNNGDVVVANFHTFNAYGSVVVTDKRGNYRFTYTGHPAGSQLFIRGICTDPLSHILICDITTSSVHMLDKDGQFLSHLLTIREKPCSVSYDVNTNRLWVGMWNNSGMAAFTYITEQDDR